MAAAQTARLRCAARWQPARASNPTAGSTTTAAAPGTAPWYCPLVLRRYYQALRPCVHYLPFWQHSPSDVLGLLRTLRATPDNQAVAQHLAANGQAFAAAHLTDEAAWLYLQRVVDRYVQLFSGSTTPAATKVALARAEAWGRRASKAGRVAEEDCYAAGRDLCWEVGQEAARMELAALKSEAGQGGATASQGGGPGGGGGGAPAT